MRFRRTAALALAALCGCATLDAPAFYLMTAPTIPNKGQDANAPISSWVRVKTFDHGMDLGQQCWAEE